MFALVAVLRGMAAAAFAHAEGFWLTASFSRPKYTLATLPVLAGGSDEADDDSDDEPEDDEPKGSALDRVVTLLEDQDKRDTEREDNIQKTVTDALERLNGDGDPSTKSKRINDPLKGEVGNELDHRGRRQRRQNCHDFIGVAPAGVVVVGQQHALLAGQGSPVGLACTLAAVGARRGECAQLLRRVDAPLALDEQDHRVAGRHL